MNKLTVMANAFAILVIFAFVGAQAAGIQDSESASHGEDSASYSLVDTYAYPNFKVLQFNLAVLSHYSYLLCSGDECLVVDPGRDTFTYLEYAQKENVTIKGVLLTHSHADFVAGHLELAKALGCPVYASATGNQKFPHESLSESSAVAVGTSLVKAIETPGHTPDGLTLCVFNAPEDAEPLVLFTGDTLFVGSVGRPDLLEGAMSAAELASMGFDTWTNKLSKLPDAPVFYPAHGAGSLCGAHLSDKPFSTIGEERVSNHYLQFKGRSDYIAAVLDGIPEAPQYFKHNAAMNRQGPELVDWNAPLPPSKTPDSALTEINSGYVVDVRDAQAYAEGHIPNSINIGIRGRFETWTGIMVPWGAPLVVTGSENELKEAVYRLHRVGYKADVIPFDAWQQAGLAVSGNTPANPRELYQKMQEGIAPILVDVRLPNEWMGLRIGNVVNLPLNHLAQLSAKLNPKEPVVTVCNSAYRSSMAIGILEREGFTNVSSLEGGSEAWINEGLPVYGSESAAQGTTAAAPASPKRVIPLPERMSAMDLKRLLTDLPGTFDLVDIRPPEQFADYSLPGARNVDIPDLVGNPGFLTGAGPLIIIDRDGSLAMAVAGILSQKTSRPIKALYGGLDAYWAESELNPAVREVPLVGASPQAAPRTTPPAATPPAPIPASPKPAAKKKSAGC